LVPIVGFVKLTTKHLGEAADVSSARGTTLREAGKLMVGLLLLVIVIYFGVGLIVDIIVPRISFEAERALFSSGRFFAEEFSEDAPELERAQAVLDKLTADPLAPPMDYRVVFVDEDEPNAFAFPGGVIGVTAGLMKSLDEEVELAFVLGHEIGHFNNRDHLRGIGRAVGVGILYAFLFDANANAGSLLHEALEKRYSRRQEERADQFGVELVYRVYGKTDGVDRLFNILDRSEDLPDWAYMLTTHPAPRRRIQDLSRYAKELAVSGEKEPVDVMAPAD
jgi:Zn-dependent protease with chaperone function